MTPEEPGHEYDGLRHDIEHTRSELGETVQALAAKADVKARAHQMADEAKSRVQETTRDAATKAGATTRGVASMAGSATREAASKATRVARPMMRRPVAWVLAALAGIGVASAVRRARRR